MKHKETHIKNPLINYGNSINSGETRVFIIYSLTAALLVPIVNFFIYDLNNTFNFPFVSILLSLYFLAIPFLIKQSIFIKKHLEKFIIYGFYITTLFGFLLFYDERNNDLSFFTFVITAFAITIAIQKRIATIIYFLWVLALYFFTFILTENFTNFNSFFILFFILSIAYVISYSRYYLYNLLKKSNDYLKISENTYKAFFDESQDLIVVLSSKGDVIDVNKKFIKISGKEKNDLLAQQYTSISDEHNPESDLFESILYFIKEKSMSEINFQSELHFDKISIPVITRITKNFYFGEPANILFFRDITEIVENEIKLKRGRENLSLVLDNIDSIVYYVFIDDKNQKHIRYISPQIRKMLGITVDDFITYMKSNKILDLYHPDDVDQIRESAKKILENKKKQVVNYRIKNQIKDKFIWVEEKIYPKYDESGRHIANFGIITDISERITNEQKLIASEKKYKQLFDKNMAGVFQTELSGDLINFNEAFIDIFGYKDSNEVFQLTADDFYFSNEDREEYINELQKRGSITNYFVKLKKKNGDLIWANLNSNIVNYEGREIIEGTLIDVTESKKYEQQLTEREQQYTMLFSKSNDGILILIDQKINKINNKILDFFQIPHDHFLLDLSIYEFFEKINVQWKSKEDFKLFDKIHDEQNLSFEITYTISNEDRYFEISTTSFSNKNQQITQIIFKDITQRKEYEIAVNKSRESFQNTLENVPDAIVVLRELDFLYYNPAFENMVGNIKPNQELVLKEYFSNADFEILLDIIDQTTNGQQTEYKELKLISDEMYTDVGVQVVKSSYNNQEAIILIIQDVSYRYELSKEKLKVIIEKETNKNLQKEINHHKLTQEKLTELEKYTRSIINSSSDTIIATNSKGLISEINPQSIIKFGYEESDILGHSPEMLFKDKALFKSITETVNSTGIYEGEFIGLKKNGETFLGFITTSRLLNEFGESIGYMGIIKDITQQKESEKQLREQNSKIQAIFDNNSNIMIWTINKHYEITSYNKSFKNECQRILNIDISKNTNFYDVLQDRITPLMKEDIESFIQSAFKGNPQEMEGYIEYDVDRKLWLETFISPIKYDGFDVDELAFIAHDTTDKKTIYNKMKESLEEKEVLLKEVHHRVKNNLQVISSILNLQSSYVSDQNTLSILRESQNRIKSMSFIHENLYQTENFSSINFSEYIINLTGNLIHTYQMTSNPIHLEHKADDITLNLDQAIPCGLIVNELVSNAIKYAFKDIKKPILKVEIHENQNIITIIVADNGIGIPKEIDIYNTDSLGLQLVFTLIDQIDGNIDIKISNGTQYLIKFEKQ